MGALAVNGTASPLAAWEHGKIGLSWGGAGVRLPLLSDSPKDRGLVSL